MEMTDHEVLMDAIGKHIVKHGNVNINPDGGVDIFNFEFDGINLSDARELVLYSTIIKLQDIFCDLVEKRMKEESNGN